MACPVMLESEKIDYSNYYVKFNPFSFVTHKFNIPPQSLQLRPLDSRLRKNLAEGFFCDFFPIPIGHFLQFRFGIKKWFLVGF
jgi:hypothetical protein